jgi:hypothetical protein
MELGNGLDAMKVNKLPDLLARVAEILERSGAKRPAEGVRALGHVLAEEIANSGEEAIAVVRERLAARSRPKENGKSERPRVSIEEYVARLDALQGEASLDVLVQEFLGKGFKKADVDKIAHRYAKGPAKYKSKMEAVKDIERRFLQRARAANELDYLEKKKVTPW